MPEKVELWRQLGPTGPQNKVNLYELLRVDELCDEAELKAAFKLRALEEHPDKGGDQDRFDELTRAYGVLEKAESRDAYDQELVEARARARLIEGGPTNARPAEEAKTDLTKKTAPHVGSNRSKDWHKCSDQWKGDKSGIVMVQQIRLAIADAEGPAALQQKAPEELLKDQTEALWEKFVTLNPGVKKQWLSTLSGKQKAALKAYAKVEEGKEMQKKKAWLAGANGKPPTASSSRPMQKGKA